MFSAPVIQKVCDPTVYDQLCGGGCLGKTLFFKGKINKLMLCSGLFVFLKMLLLQLQL